MLLFDYPTTQKVSRVLVSAHDSSIVLFIVAEAGLMKKAYMHDPVAAHSPWQPCAQYECAGSACSNDLISVLPRRSR